MPKQALLVAFYWSCYLLCAITKCSLCVEKKGTEIVFPCTFHFMLIVLTNERGTVLDNSTEHLIVLSRIFHTVRMSCLRNSYCWVSSWTVWLQTFGSSEFSNTNILTQKQKKMCISHSKNVQILRHTKHVEVSSNLPSVTSKINTSDIESIIHTGKKLKTVWHFLLSTFQKHTWKETEKGTNLQKLRIHLEKFGDLNSCTECTLKLQSVLHGSCKVVPYYIFSETTVGHVRKHWTLFGIVGCQAKQS